MPMPMLFQKDLIASFDEDFKVGQSDIIGRKMEAKLVSGKTRTIEGGANWKI